MTGRRMMFLAAIFAIACLALAGIKAQDAGAGAGAQGGGRGGRGGGGRGGGGMASAQPKGTLTPIKVDERGEGWMVKNYLNPKHLPLYNTAKQKLLDQKQVNSYTISRLDPELYCETRKHYDFIWFEMQHSTMTWGDMEKMIAACPGMQNGYVAAPMIRMPNDIESDMQKGGDIGALGFVVPTISNIPSDLSFAGNVRFARYPPDGRRSTGAGQYNSIWGANNMRQPGQALIASAPAFNYAETINDNMLVVVMIETVEGVIEANEIANTFGVDCIIEGNSDLSRFSGFNQNDDRYEDLMIRVHDAAIKAGKFYGHAGAQFQTGNILSADGRLYQNGPAFDGWTPPARGASQAAEPTFGAPGGAAAPAGGGGRGRRGGGAGAPAPPQQ
jgi:2-keto-3-deoxy-L-rhamnonate aldolase RhmA